MTIYKKLLFIFFFLILSFIISFFLIVNCFEINSNICDMNYLIISCNNFYLQYVKSISLLEKNDIS